MRRAVFIDRDNTLIKDPGFFHDPKAVEFTKFALEGLKQLSANNFLIFIVTNQSGIGRKIFSIDQMHAVHERIRKMLKQENIHINDIYFCPHRPDENCKCRKPSPYLVKKAVIEHSIALEKSFFIGNDTKDMKTGKNAGLKTISVFMKEIGDKDLIDFQAKHLKEAAEWIIKLEQ